MEVDLSAIKKGIAIILGGVLGGLLGFFFPTVGEGLGPLGDLYLEAFQMCTIPIIVTSLISSLGKIFMTDRSRILIKISIVILISFIFTAFLSLMLSFLIKPGFEVGSENKKMFGKLMYEKELEHPEAAKDKESRKQQAENLSFLTFIQSIVPKNIFESLAQSHLPSIFFFSILTGVALGKVRRENSELLINLFSTLFDGFLQIIEWLAALLPLGVFCLLAGTVSTVGFTTIIAFGKGIIIIYGVSIIISILAILIICKRLNFRLGFLCKALSKTIIFALASGNVLVAMLPAIEVTSTTLRVDKETTGLVIPFGLLMFSAGMTAVFLTTTIFVGNLYEMVFSINSYLIMIVGSIIAAITAPDMPLTGAINVISIIFDQLGLPTAMASTLVSGLDPIFDPIICLVDILSVIAITVLVQQPAPK